MVMDPKANTILNGPSAPTEDTLENWLMKHPSFHVVMPTFSPSSKFYGYLPVFRSILSRILFETMSSFSPRMKKSPSVKETRVSKTTSPQKELSAAEKSSLIDQKLAEYRQSALSSLSAARSSLKESSKKEKHGDNKEKERRRVHDLSKSPQPVRLRKEPVGQASTAGATRRLPPTKGENVPASTQSHDPKPIREKTVHGMEEALRSRISKCADVSFKNDELTKLVKTIEEELFRLYNKDVGPKYKNKYRSLVFNIKDDKNNGLFRKIINGKISPRSLVQMTAEEMANKELQQWRQAELEHGIEKIKEFERDQLAMGNKFVVKTHKGEQIIDADDSKAAKVEVKLPDEMPSYKKQSEMDAFSSWAPKTWEVKTNARSNRLFTRNTVSICIFSARRPCF